MTKNEYNGWHNYETWLCKLWMDNSEGDQAYWSERAQEIYDQAEPDSNFTKDEQAALDLSEALKEQFEEQQTELTGVTGFWADLLSAAMSEINWHEIAEHLIEDDVEKVEPEEIEAE
jgi:hypothetical protein